MNKFFLPAFCCSLMYGNFSNAQNLGTIESLEYDHLNHRFLVSNANNVVEVDNTGDPIAEFGTEPEADYGMEVMGTALYAIVGDDVRAYDLTSGLEVSAITISGAQFLNGMASDGDHRIWVTDFQAKKIYEIDFSNLASPSYVEIVANTVTTPNGICYDETNDRLLFVNWEASAKIKAVALSDYTVSTVLDNAGVGSIDGIDNDNYGNYFIASWNPNRITKFNSDFSVSEIITVAGGLSSPADIAYAEEIDTLIIPNAGNETVRFVGFSAPSAVISEENPLGFSCYPNPVAENSVLAFTLATAGNTTITIMDGQGRIVEEILHENLPATRHKIVLGDLDIAPGSYLWHVKSGEAEFTLPFIRK